MTAALLALALGSIPFGYLIGRAFYGRDIRTSGSGNIGAANALRTFGRGGAALVLLLDACKGLVPVLVALDVARGGYALAASVALLAVLAHCYTPWLHFKGGKGVATWLGALFALDWVAGLAFVAVWIAVALPTRFASLASLVATAASAVLLGALHPATALAAGATVVLIFWKHRENIVRLREGRENRIARTLGKPP